MLKLLKADLRYALLSKIGIGILLLMIGFTGLTYLLGYNHAVSSYDTYLHILEFTESAGEDVGKELAKDYQILEDGVIANPLPYEHERVGTALYSLSPRYVLSLFCEQALPFFPIIASFFGVLWSAADLKSKVYRHRVLRFGQTRSLLGRQLSGFLLLLLVMLTALLLSFGMQAFTYRRLLSALEIDAAAFAYTPPIPPPYLKQLLFAAASALFYYVLGFTFGFASKGNPIVAVLVCVYTLFIPTLGAYDISNIFINAAADVFSFLGPFSAADPLPLNLPLGILMLCGIVIAMMLCNLLIAKKRSAY